MDTQHGCPHNWDTHITQLTAATNQNNTTTDQTWVALINQQPHPNPLQHLTEHPDTPTRAAQLLLDIIIHRASCETYLGDQNCNELHTNITTALNLLKHAQTLTH